MRFLQRDRRLESLDLAVGLAGIIDVRDYGAVFNGVTDDTTAIQAALNAAVITNYLNLPNANDWPCKVVWMPAGRTKISSSLQLNPNQIIRGHSEASTYLDYTGTAEAIKLKTGTEPQIQLRDFGIIQNSNAAKGIELIQTGGASILGDYSHLIENIVVVGGRTALRIAGDSETRVINLKAYRQVPTVGEAAVYLSGTDYFIERVTVAQPQYPGSGTQGAGFRLNTSNSRIVNCKVFGGNAPAASAQYGFYMIGQRNSITGLEIQDYVNDALGDDQGNNIYSGLIVDSCRNGIALSGPAVITSGLIVNRGGSYTMPYAMHLPNGTGAYVDCRVVSVAATFNTGQDGTGNYVRANGLWQPVQTYTPTNVTTDRAYDANATTLDEVADSLGTLIADLKTRGLLS